MSDYSIIVDAELLSGESTHKCHVMVGGFVLVAPLVRELFPVGDIQDAPSLASRMRHPTLSHSGCDAILPPVLSTAHTVTTSNIIFTQYSACAVLRPDSSVRVEVSTERWRPLVVEVGAMGSVSGISKLAASVIGPLADRGVSVFCLSTNMEDYVMVS